jgi:hypothetical protein
MPQFWYSWFSCSSGWFCNANPSVASFVAMEVLQPGSVDGGGSSSGVWTALEVPPSVRALVLVNLQSYAGGRNIWGEASEASRRKHGWHEPTPDDGLIEVGWVMGGACRECHMDMPAPAHPTTRLSYCQGQRTLPAAWHPLPHPCHPP